MSKRITVVSTWYGPDTAGGAEVAARALAHALHRAGAQVEVWSTTARDLFAPTQPYYPAGDNHDQGILVRRFALAKSLGLGELPVSVRRNPACMRVLTQVQPEAQELRVLSSHPHSDELIHAIATAEPSRRFLFVPYPLPISLWGVMSSPAQSFLLPCMHDEPYAAHRLTKWQLEHACGILANSRAEREFILEHFACQPERVVLTRLGIDMQVSGDGTAFRRAHNIQHPMLFFAGRRDDSKNVPLLIRYVQEYILRRQRMLTLVLAGRDPLHIPAYQRAFVRDVGFLSEQGKADAFAACDVFVHAGTQESFAFVLMEAWLQRRPALVNCGCAVTTDAVNEAQAGLAFADFAEFAAALDVLLANPQLATQLGQAGHDYVTQQCRWSDVAHRALTALTQL